MKPAHLTEYLRRSVSLVPDRIAIVESEGAQITYAELNRQSDALAAHLVAQGVVRGDHIGVMLPKSIAAIVSFFAAMKAGAAYVPIDRTAPAARTSKILEDSALAVLIAERSVLEVLEEAAPAGLPPLILHGDGLDFASSFESIVASGAAPPPVAVDSSDLAYIIFTSGSTGAPKGAMLTHANVISYAEWAGWLTEATSADRVSAFSPLHFDASVHDLYLAIRHGAALYLIPDDVAKSPRDLARFVARHRLTLWLSTPSSLMMLAQFGQLQDHDMSSLRLVAFGGEIFPVKHLRVLKMLWTGAAFYNLYGPTETTVACTYYRIPDVIPADRVEPFPIGVPCQHCVGVAVAEDGRPAARGEVGELQISGPSVFTGYLNRPAETESALIHRDGRLWYRTGDIVRDDGDEGFTYVGRRDGMVKRRGYRIELGEIERALLEHPRVNEAAVVAIPSEDTGVRIVAFVACHGRDLSVVDLKVFCANKIPPYMVPDRFVVEDALPATSTGKRDYQRLKMLATARLNAGRVA